MRPVLAVPAAVSVPEAAGEFGELAERILVFERLHWKYPAAKEGAIRQNFSLSATHYYQILNALANSETAYRFDPVLIKQIRAKRLSRHRSASVS